MHWPGLPDLAASTGPDFDHLDMPRLSRREAEVVRLMLKGNSTKSMARLMGNSPETVKVHCKRTYSKLGNYSQGELFSRFSGTQGCAPISEGKDVQMGLLNET
jgi:DNA-binding CsgD family transcriptional regulator